MISLGKTPLTLNWILYAPIALGLLYQSLHPQSRYTQNGYLKLNLMQTGELSVSRHDCSMRNEQKAGVNYNDTFAPVLDLSTARMILALSVLWHCPARHGDIPAAYTKGAIESDADIYMYFSK
jgi:hypothetical protein